MYSLGRKKWRKTDYKSIDEGTAPGERADIAHDDSDELSSHARRRFLKNTSLATLATMVGTSIPFGSNVPFGFVPAAMAQDNVLSGKDGLTLLNDRPVNAETPPEFLDDAITPTDRHFIRNNGLLPDDMDAATWTLTVDGFVDTPMELSIDDLRDPILNNDRSQAKTRHFRADVDRLIAQARQMRSEYIAQSFNSGFTRLRSLLLLKRVSRAATA